MYNVGVSLHQKIVIVGFVEEGEEIIVHTREECVETGFWAVTNARKLCVHPDAICESCFQHGASADLLHDSEK